MTLRISPSADVAGNANVGVNCQIWDLAQIRENAVIGDDCIIGRGAYIGPGVKIGSNCKIQNYALIYEPAILEGGVFIGPGAILTNDQYPRAVTPSGALKRAEDWQTAAVRCLEGASIGANAVCVAPVTVGRWAMVAAGAVVVHDVPNFALVAGVPARRVHWVGPAGAPLREDRAGIWICPTTGSAFVEQAGNLVEAP